MVDAVGLPDRNEARIYRETADPVASHALLIGDRHCDDFRLPALQVPTRIRCPNALQTLGHDADSFAAHSQALAAARDDRDLALEQYRAGKYTELQVLTAEQQYQQAALTQVQADVQRFTDTAALFRALGGGWWNAPIDPATLAQLGSGPLGEKHE